MPLILEIQNDDFQLKVWKIEEENDFFFNNTSFTQKELAEFEKINHAKKQKEWLASRFALKLINPQISIQKDSYSNPHVANKPGDISISHCDGYAAAAYSPNKKIGIDIEPIHEKIHRIKHKFLNKKELNHVDTHEETTHLITHWCLKEATYKWYGKKSLAFKEDILIHPFCLADKKTKVDLITQDDTYQLNIVFFKIQSCILAYTTK